MNKIIKISINVIIALLIFSILSLFGIYFLLATRGIKLDNINYQNIHIKKLYIKIDKKLVIKANNIKILTKNSNTKTNYNQINKIIEKSFIYLNYLENIDLKNIQINQNRINYLNFSNNTLKADTNLAHIEISFKPINNQTISFLIHNVTYKPLHISLNNIKGIEKADLFKLNIDAQYKYQNSKINVSLKAGRHIKYIVKIDNLNEKLVNKFTPILKENNITLNIKSINIKGNEKKLNLYASNLNFTQNNKLFLKTPILNANYNITKNNYKLFIKNSNLIKDNLKIFSKNININGNLNSLNFDTYNNKVYFKDYNLSINNLKGNFDIKNKNYKATIINNRLIQKNLQVINQKIDVNGNFNLINFNAIKNDILLNEYKLNIKASNLKGNFNINKNILNLTSNEIRANNLIVKNLLLKIKNNIINLKLNTNELLSPKLIAILKKFNLNIPIYQKNGKNSVFLNLKYNLNNGKIDTYLKANILNSKLMLTESTYLTIKNANLELNNSLITLKNSNLNYKESIVNLDYFIKKGIIDLNKNFIKTTGIIKNLNLENIGDIKDFNESMYINLNNLSIYLKHLKTDILIGKNININVNKLSVLYPYIKYLKEYKILNGNIKITINNKIKITTNITNTKQKIIAKHFHYLNKIKLNTTIKNNNITITNPNFKVNIINKNPMIIDAGIKNLDINITKFVKESLETNKTESKSNKKSNQKNQEYIVTLKGINDNIIYNDSILYSHYLSMYYDKNYTHIESINNDRNITVIKKNGELKIYAFNIKEKELKKLAGIDFIKNAKINAFAFETNQSTALNGFIEINRGYIKELKAFNNIIAFINLIPSLVTFHGPGFSEKGFKIRYGHIDYIYDEGIFYIKKADVRGDNLKFKAQGYIDLVKKTINMNVNVTIIVKLIKDIPIVNYIILGKDGGITLKLKVSGKLKNPKVEKNLAKGIIEAPFGIIKRTLITPFRLFMKE